MNKSLRLMCVLAHPDDESLALGGMLAKYAAEGIETSLVMATRGERGWFRDWRAYPGERALGALREQELRAASEALRIARLDFLDYTDGCLDSADESEVIAKIVHLLRLVQPHVVVTFGPEGLYGHPDHIAISQFTTSAIICATDPSYPCARHLAPHCVSKLYYKVASEHWFTRYMPIFGEFIMHIDGQERRAHPWVSWTITTRVDTTAYWRAVWQAIRCHQTQIPAASVLERISEQEHEQLWGPQEFYRAFSLVNGGRREERDLFEGLNTVAANVSVPLHDKQLSYAGVELAC